MARDDITRKHYTIVADNKRGDVFKVFDPLPDDSTPDHDDSYPFDNDPGYYMRIAELEYGENGLYKKLGKTGPQDELLKFMKASGLLSILMATNASTLNSEVHYDEAREAKKNKLIHDIVKDRRKYKTLETKSQAENRDYTTFKKLVENSVGFQESVPEKRKVEKSTETGERVHKVFRRPDEETYYVLDNLVERFLPHAEYGEQHKKKSWLQKHYIFSIYEKMLWSGVERLKKYRVDANWHKSQEIVFASYFLDKGRDLPHDLYTTFTPKIGNFYYFILNHTNLAGYCYLIQHICKDEAFYEFVEDYEDRKLFSHELYYDEETGNLLYRLLSDETNRIYPFTRKNMNYKEVWEQWCASKQGKSPYPAETDDITIKNAWAAKTIKELGYKYIVIQDRALKIERLSAKDCKNEEDSGYFVLKPLDETDRIKLQASKHAGAKMRYLQYKLRLVNLLAYDKLGEDYQRPVDERIQICLDVINNDPQVKALEAWEQFYEDWRAKFKTQLERVSDLVAVHLDPEYKDYGPCVIDERLEKAYALLTEIEDSLVDKKEDVFHKK